MSQKISVPITITGHERHVQKILMILRYMEYLGNVGHSTSFKVSVDGDGAARIGIEFPNPEMDESILKEIKSRMDGNSDIKSFGLD